MRETAATMMAAGYDPATEFDFGLDVIIDVLERRRESGRWYFSMAGWAGLAATTSGHVTGDGADTIPTTIHKLTAQ